MSDRVQIAATVARDVHAALRDRARATGMPFSRILDAAARRGLGLPETPMLPELAPRDEAEPKKAA